MKKCAVLLFASCLALSSAKAVDSISDMNFVVSHPTSISAMGAYDGGTGFTSTETVGIFSDLSGNLVGSEVVFGPGKVGTQVGDMFYESVPVFVLSPGDYSIIEVGNGGFPPSGGGSHLSGGNSFLNLGDDVDLPGGGRFNSGATFDISLNETSGLSAGSIDLVDPKTNFVPDGGLTALLLGASLAGLGWVRRKF
jgi:hypothetical protein